MISLRPYAALLRGNFGTGLAGFRPAVQLLVASFDMLVPAGAGATFVVGPGVERKAKPVHLSPGRKWKVSVLFFVP